MKDFWEKLEKKWAVKSSDLKDTIQDIPKSRRLFLEDEDEEFKEEFHQVVNSKDLKDIYVAKRNVKRTHATSGVTKIGKVNPYIGIELGLNKGDE